MNRPYWLDLVMMAALLLPPITVALLGTAILSKSLELPGWAAVLTDIVGVTLALGIWVVGLAAWARIKTRSSTVGKRQDRGPSGVDRPH
jgi:hypothetical protein